MQEDSGLAVGWRDEIRRITLKAAETSWPLTAFCCFFFIFVEIGNIDNSRYMQRFYLLDFGSCLVMTLAHLLRHRIRYPAFVITYGSSIFVAIVSTVAAVITVPENVFTYFIIVSLITVVRGLLYCQKVSTVAVMAVCNHLVIFLTTLLLREEPYFSLPNILSTNIIQLFMVMFALSGANIRYNLTHDNFISSHKIKSASQIIEDKNRDITDSINYARRIQASLLASNRLLRENLPEHFIFFQPKDIVSGDFYWAAPLSNGSFAVAVADSTGHGVPGAIMSILNISCLNEAVNAERLKNTDDILNYARNRIMEHMANDGSEEGGKDGMDAVLASFNFRERKLDFAAANNPLWLVRDGKLQEFEPDKMPVGKPMGNIVPFSASTIELQKDDLVVLLTDGFADQFGGPKGKKYMYKQLKELVLAIYHLPVSAIEERLRDAFATWKGSYEQVDDVLIFGIRIR
jgi:serine phosphatase RsbU (regulator of sigma subunit)